MLEFINEELEQLKKSGLHRSLKMIEKVSGARITINGKAYLNFCSNDYLGLSQHPKVKEKAIAIIKEFGFGAGASRLISGNTIMHEKLENRIAKFKGKEAAIIFPTGYMANLGGITVLVNENDTVIIDRLNHASIIDACRFSRAKLQVYPHKDMKALEKILARSEKYRRRLIVTDSVFSMDGDIAPVAEIAELGKAYQATTMTDDAHATGVVEIEGKPDIVMGTLSKAIGSFGGFIAGSAKLIDYLKNKARSFIYTTALPPAACAASLAALEVIENHPPLQQKLWENIRLIRKNAESGFSMKLYHRIIFCDEILFITSNDE
jgi:glycine C-acetyltransferase/8-amino-7-oxononanoate synthase